MKNISTKKKTALILLSALLVTGILGTGIFAAKTITGESESRIAYEEKDLAYDIGSKENPYTILEVVPNASMATLGYLIPGQEPIGAEGMQKIYESDSDSRLIDLYYSLFGQENSIATVYRKNQSAFKLDTTGSKWSLGTEYDNSKIGETVSGVKQKGYGEYGYFLYVGENGDFSFVKGNAFESAYFTHVEDKKGDFAWITIGKYTESDTGAYSISTAANNSVNRNSIFTDRNITLGNKWYETGNENAIVKYKLDIDSELLTESGEYLEGEGISHDFFENDVITRYYSKTSELNEETLKTAGKRYYTDRCERYWINFDTNTIENKDALIGTLFPGKSSVESGGNIYSQVIVVTPKMLSDISSRDLVTLINLPDMVVFHQMAGVSKNGEYVDAASIYEEINDDSTVLRGEFDEDNDIPSLFVSRFLTREAGGSPAAVLFDNNTVKNGADNLFKLYGALSEKGAKYAYNMWYSDPTEEDPENPNGNWDKLDNEVKNFKVKSGFYIGASNFVLDFDGNLSSFTTDALRQDIFLNDDENLLPAFSTHVLPERTNLSEELTDQFTLDEAGEISGMSSTALLTTVQNLAWHKDYKDKLRILEIEPTYEFIYDEEDEDREWVSRFIDFFPWFIGTTQDLSKDVEVNCMSTEQFIGKIEDVNSNYDLIFFGTSQDFRNGIDGYNDENMNNYEGGSRISSLIYTAIGDYVNSTLWRVSMFDNGDRYDREAFLTNNAGNGNGWSLWPINNSTATNNGDGEYAAARKGSDQFQTSNRYTGNDLTRKKAVAIENFARSNAVIFSDDFFTYSGASDNTINTATGSVNRLLIDERSEVYYLSNISKTVNLDIAPEVSESTMAGERLSKLNNGFIIKESTGVKDAKPVSFEDSKNQGEYENINGQRVYLGYPVEYKAEYADKKTTTGATATGAITSQTSNNQKNDLNQDVLRFTFTLDGVRNVPYNLRLCMDSNGNGIFEGDLAFSEEQSAFDPAGELSYSSEVSQINQIRDITAGQYSAVNITDGNLYAGHTYEVTRIIPDDTAGAIPYQLEIYRSDNSKSRGAIRGITRVAKQSDEVKILCMNPTITMLGEPKNNAKFYDESTEVGAKFRTYLDAASDFNVKMDYLSNSTPKDSVSVCELDITPEGKSFMTDFAADRDKWIRFITQYDMLILGYRDSAEFTTNAVFVDGFKEFVREGKSVIISHDMVTDIDAKAGSYLYDSQIQYMNSLSMLREMTGQLAKIYIPGTNNYSYSTAYVNSSLEDPMRATVAMLPMDIARDRKPYVTEKHAVGTNYYDTASQFRLSNGTLILRQGEMTGDKWGTEQSQSDIAWVTDENSDKASLWMWRVNSAYVHSEQYVRYFFNSSLAGKRSTEKGVAYRQGDGNATYRYENLSAEERLGYEPASIVTNNSYRAIAFSRTMESRYPTRFGFYTGNNTPVYSWTYQTNQVEIANRGQMTSYPYELEEINNGYIKVAYTHAQNFSLDMEYDATDDDGDKAFDGDVTVWFNLAGPVNSNIEHMSKSVNGYTNLYDMYAGDSQNNYYVYTKGNITYTGFGHQSQTPTMTDDEIKLFVNCMISSYRAPASPPYAEVTNDDVVVNNGEYVTYIEDLGNPTEKDGNGNPINPYAANAPDATIELQINDNSRPNQYTSTYTLTVTDSEGNIIDNITLPDGGAVSEVQGQHGVKVVEKDGKYVVHIPYSEIFGKAENIFNLTVKSEYTTPTGIKIPLEKTTVARVMFMPFFDLY